MFNNTSYAKQKNRICIKLKGKKVNALVAGPAGKPTPHPGRKEEGGRRWDTMAWEEDKPPITSWRGCLSTVMIQTLVTLTPSSYLSRPLFLPPPPPQFGIGLLFSSVVLFHFVNIKQEREGIHSEV